MISVEETALNATSSDEGDITAEGGESEDSRFTKDAILSGKISLIQPKNGYRFSLDAVLLAFFVKTRPTGTILDLGCGCGVISLILAHRFPGISAYGVEIQRELFEAATQNANFNGFSERVRILRGDFTLLPCPGLPRTINTVVCNPPFRRTGAGRTNPLSPKALARHEIKGSLALAASTASRLLCPKGGFFCVYPASRLAHLITSLCAKGLEPKRLRMVHPRTNEAASLVLVEARKGGGPELLVEPPLIIHDNGGYTAELEAILG